MTAVELRILGIDPGSSRIGFGLIGKKGSVLSLIKTGVIEIPKGDAAEKLNALAIEFKKLIAKSNPDAIGIEKLFFSKNVKTGIEVAQARGLLLHLSNEYFRLLNPESCIMNPLYEFTPQQVKVATTNYGGADKKAVARMVAMILSVPPLRILDDATDAIAIAIATAGVHRVKKTS
ncbi:MAG: crossover junction endodeoxyribonuclease RuvC [bacterium]|nr:crossover junction endodeoxyribonuclease RuvC [bacterium]